MTKSSQEFLEHRREYISKYVAEHPERRIQWRINAAVNLLKRHGWRLVPPTESSQESNQESKQERNEKE